MSEDKTIVVDNGSGTIFAGFAGDDDPISIFSNLSGSGGGFNKSVNFAEFSDADDYTTFVNAHGSGGLKITYPIEHGVIKNWDSMEAVWEYTFSTGLEIKPEEVNLLITEAMQNPKPNREKMAQILFEKFNFPAISISPSAILPLYSAGLTTGVVLDIGDGVAQAVPVWGGYPITEGFHRVDIGGRDVTNLLSSLLQSKGNGSKPLEIIRLIKENACHVASNLVEEVSSRRPEATFKLPDGETITLGDESFRCSELLFNPSFIEESDKPGVHEILYKSIMRTNMDIRKDLYGNIVLSGGSTLFPGFVERLTKEITDLVPTKAKINIIADPGRKYSTWRGGSVLGSLSNFGRLLISKQEFEEVGVSVVHQNKI